MGNFGKTAGSTCEFWVDPVNFTLRYLSRRQGGAAARRPADGIPGIAARPAGVLPPADAQLHGLSHVISQREQSGGHVQSQPVEIDRVHDRGRGPGAVQQGQRVGLNASHLRNTLLANRHQLCSANCCPQSNRAPGRWSPVPSTKNAPSPGRRMGWRSSRQTSTFFVIPDGEGVQPALGHINNLSV